MRTIQELEVAMSASRALSARPNPERIIRRMRVKLQRVRQWRRRLAAP
jgi:hypothetical protein